MRLVVVAAIVAWTSVQAEPTPKLDCTKLASKLAARFETEGRTTGCMAGTFKPPGVLVWASGRANDQNAFLIAVADRSGALRTEPTDIDHNVMDPEPTFDLVDLDGDGVDEIIEEHTTDRHYDGMRLIVWRIAGTKIEELDVGWVRYDNSSYDRDPPTICEGTFDFPTIAGKRRLMITSKVTSDPSHTCLPTGRHVFAVRGGKLEQL